MPNGRCKLHGGKTPSGPASVHFIHGHRSAASEENSKIITQLGRLSRLVEKTPLGQPVMPEAVALYGELQVRCYAHDLRCAGWRRMRESQEQ